MKRIVADANCMFDEELALMPCRHAANDRMPKLLQCLHSLGNNDMAGGPQVRAAADGQCAALAQQGKAHSE